MKMQRLLFFLLSTLMLVSCKSENKDKSTLAQETNDALKKHYIKLFDRAMKFKDPYTGIYCAQAICMLDSTKESRKYMDTLAGIYETITMSSSASLIADEILKKEPNNIKMLDIKQSNAISTGKVEEAVTLNNKLYDLTKKNKYLFHIAYIDIELKKYQEGIKVLDEIQSKPNIEKDSVEFQMGQGGGVQMIPMNAADIYLRAYIDIQSQRYQQAMEKYQHCLKICPDFYKARENMQMLVQGMQQQRR